MPTTVARLLALDTRTDALIGEIAAPASEALSLVASAPDPGDSRILVLRHRGDTIQALLWDPHRDTLTPLDWPLDGLVLPAAWSPDGQDLLLYHGHAQGQRFVLASIADGTVRPTPYLEGKIRHATCTALGVPLPG
jgi:hypothetical protein